MKLPNILKFLKRKDETYNKVVFTHIGNGQLLWMPNKGESYIKDAFYTNPDVYNAIMTVVNFASRAPLNLYKVRDKKKAFKYKSMTQGLIDRESLREVRRLKAQAFEEVETDHPALALLNKPNEWQSEAAFRGNRLGFRLATGNYYVYMAFPTVGLTKDQPIGLYPLPSQYMEIVSGGLLEPVRGYVNTYGGTRIEIPAKQVIHNRAWSLDYSYPGSHLYGVSPIKAASTAITTNNSGRVAHVRTLQNGGKKGVLVLPDKTDATAEQLQAIKDQFANESGLDSRGKPIITTDKAEWVEMGLDALEMSIIEALKESGKDIYKVFGVDVNMFSTDATTENNKKEAIKNTLFMGVIPLLISDRDSLNSSYLPYFDKSGELFFDYDLTVYPELNENRKELAEVLDKMWYLKANEKRIEAGYDEDLDDENMNKYYIPANLEPLDRANTELDMPNLPISNDYGNEDK